MKKLITVIFASALVMIFATQLQQTFAKQHDKDNSNTPITSPITGPQCKPGWGFGDKNHCHFGPPGQSKQNDNDQREDNNDQHESSNSAKENND